MLRVLSALALAAMPAGCCCSPASTGWSFQVGRPAVHESSTLLSPGMTSYGMAGVATVPAYGGAVVTAPAQALALAGPGRMVGPELAPAPRMATRDPCDGISIEELCRRVIELERALKAPGKKLGDAP